MATPNYGALSAVSNRGTKDLRVEAYFVGANRWVPILPRVAAGSEFVPMHGALWLPADARLRTVAIEDSKLLQEFGCVAAGITLVQG